MSDSEAAGACLIVGLGNPGREHAGNRHNAGFMLVDRLHSVIDQDLAFRPSGESLIGRARYQGVQVFLCKPQTFMNESGRAVASVVHALEIPLERLLVAFDDLDLPLGGLRMRPSGGSSGHKGMKSIIRELGGHSFPRLRIGIGRPPGRIDPADYVLTNFRPGERELLDITLQRGAACVLEWLQNGLEVAMTHCNAFER